MNFEGRCYGCFRPVEACFCASIPSIDNKTEVLILQHRREQFHRFNTARIVRRGLRNSQLLADHNQNLAQRIQLQPRAGLLYPGPSATLISDVPADQRPQQLVVIDGTWHHTKTLMRDIPALQKLPRYRLAPTEPSRYRIRREPDALSLSTIEATVAALQILEPETLGFDRLLQAFETMIDAQVAHPGSANGSRFRVRRRRTYKNIPFALLGSLENIVVAYGEAAPGERGRKRVAGPPISWVAQRLGDGANFACTLPPPEPLSDEFLGHLELTRADFATALPLAEARRQWAEFARPSDLVVMIQPGTAQLFSYLADDHARRLVLKAVDLAFPEPAVFPEAVAARSFDFSRTLGRSTKRLESAIQLVRHLNDLAGSSLTNEVVDRGSS
ncbi:tRNA-uridine aminocarboxypropyltransferase [Anatilimnocola sp. NA78]|uniref:tRNA-uridine aminocarboxypropyltransferase n=1 Tax=Anatilimnocola sp. NA78 TaxID=3415683 RepID=UPI003CE45ED6